MKYLLVSVLVVLLAVSLGKEAQPGIEPPCEERRPLSREKRQYHDVGMLGGAHGHGYYDSHGYDGHGLLHHGLAPHQMYPNPAGYGHLGHADGAYSSMMGPFSVLGSMFGLGRAAHHGHSRDSPHYVAPHYMHDHPTESSYKYAASNYLDLDEPGARFVEPVVAYIIASPSRSNADYF